MNELKKVLIGFLLIVGIVCMIHSVQAESLLGVNLSAILLGIYHAFIIKSGGGR